MGGKKMRLQKITYKHFEKYAPSEAESLDYIFKIVYNNLRKCPVCESKFLYHRVGAKSEINNEQRKCYQCSDCTNQLYPLTETVLKKSRTDIRKWVYAAYYVNNVDSKVSINEMSNMIDVTPKCAFNMLRIIRNVYSLHDIDNVKDTNNAENDTKLWIIGNQKKTHKGRLLHRLVLNKKCKYGDIGTIGGWIQSELNISENAWVGDEAMVYDEAQVLGFACVKDRAVVCDYAIIDNNATVFEDAIVYGCAKVEGESMIYGYANVYGTCEIKGNARIYDHAFIGGRAKIENYAHVCGSSSIRGNCLIINNTCIHNGQWLKSPIQVICSLGRLFMSSKDSVTINGVDEHIDWWMKYGVDFFKGKELDPAHIDEVMLLINACKIVSRDYKP